MDVASDHLDARLRPETGPGRRFANTAEGVAELTAFCREQGVELVVMEATGGYERLAFALLWAAGIPAAIVNPRQVRRFAQAMGLLEKTDRIDAGVIAWYGEARRIVARPPAGATQRQLAALLTRLRQLVELRVAQANQRRLVDEPLVLTSIDELLALVIRQVRALEARIVAWEVRAEPVPPAPKPPPPAAAAEKPQPAAPDLAARLERLLAAGSPADAAEADLAEAVCSLLWPNWPPYQGALDGIELWRLRDLLARTTLSPQVLARLGGAGTSLIRPGGTGPPAARPGSGHRSGAGPPDPALVPMAATPLPLPSRRPAGGPAGVAASP